MPRILQNKLKAIKFRNFSNEDFSWKWDGVSFNFPAGQETYLEEDKAHHFAKHLVDREIGKINVERGLHGTKNEISSASKQDRAPLEKQCFPEDTVIEAQVALDLNEKAKEKKKKTPEFEDLKIVPRKKI